MGGKKGVTEKKLYLKDFFSDICPFIFMCFLEIYAHPVIFMFLIS